MTIKVVCVAKGSVYENLYQRLSTNEGEDIYRLIRVCERKTRDLNQVKCIKDETKHLLMEDEIRHMSRVF
jgi:hypothetical protein